MPRESAEAIRARLPVAPEVFRAALVGVPAIDRDAWVDLVLGLDGIPEDEALPQGCVPYLPCPVDALLHIAAYVRESDVFVDIGSGIGRAVTLVHLLTGAAAIGVEIQPKLVDTSRELARGMPRIQIIGGDAAQTTPIGSVYLLYCPFGGERLAKVLAELEAIARTRRIHVCCLDLPLDCPWLELLAQPSPGLAIYRSA